MKFIKSRSRFLSEAKIRDVILPRQISAVKDTWGEKWLDYEEIEATDNIKQGRWKLSDEDKNKVLGIHFQCDMNVVVRIFQSIPDKLAEVLRASISLDLFTKKDDREKYEAILANFNPKSPTVDQISILNHNIFRRLSISDTQATEIIQKDENGRPVRTEDGQMVKVAKEAGAPIFEKNLTAINGFIDAYNRCYPTERVSADMFNNTHINRLISMASENHNSDYKYDHEIFGKDLYLQILHNPKDILNMSISRFYASCQHLYSGGYRSQVLGNVFDPNSVPAFFVFDTPIVWKSEKISDILPLSRMMVRNIEGFEPATKKKTKKGESTETEPKLFFDRAYPDRMKDVMGEMIEKYSDNKETIKDRSGVTYLFTPDVELDDAKKVNAPYMDRLSIDVRPYIGVNTKTLYIKRSYDWSKTKISPKAKIKELVIETTDLPDGFTKIALTPEWIKFKFIKINDMNVFDKIKSDAIAFNKCKFNVDILAQLAKNNEELKKLQITSCDVTGSIDLSIFTKLEELHLVYTLDSIEDLKTMIGEIKLKKLLISGDMAGSKEAKALLGSFKSKGMKIEIVGPVI